MTTMRTISWRGLNARRDHRWAQSRLSAYLEGDLSPRQHRRLHAHEGICPECRRAIQTLGALLRKLPGLGQPERGGEVADRAVQAVMRRIEDS